MILPLVLAAAVSATPPAPAAQDNAPRWLTRPSDADLARAYPRPARMRGQGGRAVMQCKVTATGRLTACELVSEEPAGAGFGRALLSMAPSFSMTPNLPDGRSVEGRSISIPFRFLTR
jgi:TonB family protein